MYADLIEHLAAGATVVTPNRRLAAAVRRAFDLRARDNGQAAWLAPDVLPWNAWLERGYRCAVLQGASARLLMSPKQTRSLWQRIVDEAPEANGLLHISSTAEAAEEAWELAHAWRLWPALQSMPLAEEGHAFLRWAQSYDALCAREHLTDQTRLTDVIADMVGRRAIPLPARLVIFGFDRLTPQHQSLLQTLRENGVQAQVSAPADASGQTRAVVLRQPDVSQEVRAAAQWARAQLMGDPQSRIGIVVPELTRLRSAIMRGLDEVLVPAALSQPGRVPARPWNMSLGAPLAEWPLVHAALLILQLAGGSLGLQQVGLLLRSPFIGAANSERRSRALLDARLRRLGDPHLSLDALIFNASIEGHAFTCGLLADRLNLLRNRLRGLPAVAQPPSFWGPVVQALLAAVHWPGERELNSEEYQTFVRWKELVASLGELDLVTAPLTLVSMVHMLRRLASEQLFQPESPEVPIQVVGLLESAYLEFDHLLVLGLNDEAWPRVPRPNPLLPIELQRARGLPRASSEWELDFARRLQSGWRHAAPSLVFSYHFTDGDRTFGSSPLLAGVPDATLAGLGVEPTPDWSELMRADAVQERLADWKGAAVGEGVAFLGGARLLQDQAACPFRAFAAYRLGATALEPLHAGLDARDRGVLVHAALAGLWTEIRTRERLVSLASGELSTLVERCVNHGLERLRPRRESAFQARFLELERERLTALLLEWLEVERNRSDFAVLACEEERAVHIGGLDLKLRLDRIDSLASGGEMLIDYKTGKASTGMWKGERPDEPQLLLYAVARERTPEAVAFARVCRGESGFAGLSARPGAAPGVQQLASTGHAPGDSDWSALLSAWGKTLEHLAADFRSGHAAVDPKKRPATCQFCNFATLCRVSEVVDRGSPTSAENGFDE